MPSVALTDAYVKALPSPTSGRLEVSDLRCVGLALRVTPSGVKSWCFRYRDRLTGKTERLSLGRYPDVGLAKARERADEERPKVAGGKNPRRELRKARSAERAAITFDKLADKFLEVADKRTPKSAPTLRSLLSPARKEWKDKRAKDIERADVIAFLAKRADKAPVAANRTLTALGRLFGWSVDEGYLETTPIVRIAKPTAEKARERVLEDAELAVVWRALDTLDGTMALAFRLLALTGQRPGEIVGMTVDELYEIDKPQSARWEIPSERTKNGRRHVIPLHGMALDTIRAALAAKADDDNSSWVFVSSRKAGEPYDRHSLARAMKRLLRSLEAADETRDAVERLKADNPTPHDLRRTMITGLGRLGFPREHVKALVNHAEGDVTERHYDRYDRLPEKRRMLEAWQQHILAVVGATDDHGNVVSLEVAR